MPNDTKQNANDAGRKDLPKGKVLGEVPTKTYLSGTGDFAIGIGTENPVAAGAVPDHLRDMYRS